MNLGRDRDGHVVRYERLGDIDVSRLLREYPLGEEQSNDAALLDNVPREAWLDALQRLVGYGA